MAKIEAPNLFHLKNNVVRNSGLGEQDVELPRHAACDWMHSELDLFPCVYIRAQTSMGHNQGNRRRDVQVLRLQDSSRTGG